MKKFEVTTLSKLRYGDRFYFSKNKNLLCTYIETKGNDFYRIYIYENDNGSHIEKTQDLKVIFLRHSED